MVTDAQQPWRSVLCLYTGRSGSEGRQSPLERDMDVTFSQSTALCGSDLLCACVTWAEPAEGLWAPPGEPLCG